jgi:CheY-like chemotaxis protein
MAPDSTVVVVGRSPEKMRAATTVLEQHGFTTVAAFTEEDALRAITGSDALLAVVAGGSVSPEARERLRAAAASRGAATVDTAIGHADPAAHFTSDVLPHLVAARTARATHGSGELA